MKEISKEDILKLVSLQLGKRNIQETDRLMEDLGAESADVAIIVSIVEDKFKINIKESEIARILTPQDLFEIIRSKANVS